jgi:hypothetical protein
MEGAAAEISEKPVYNTYREYYEDSYKVII